MHLPVYYFDLVKKKVKYANYNFPPARGIVIILLFLSNHKSKTIYYIQTKAAKHLKSWNILENSSVNQLIESLTICFTSTIVLNVKSDVDESWQLTHNGWQVFCHVHWSCGPEMCTLSVCVGISLWSPLYLPQGNTLLFLSTCEVSWTLLYLFCTLMLCLNSDTSFSTLN